MFQIIESEIIFSAKIRCENILTLKNQILRLYINTNLIVYSYFSVANQRRAIKNRSVLDMGEIST
jgi:hypothetical protein